jgi:hypothetical protein
MVGAPGTVLGVEVAAIEVALDPCELLAKAVKE